MFRRVLPLWLAFIAGCGDGGHSSGTPLDCAWLAGDNCWKTTVAAAESCLPPPDARGTMSADGRTCQYGDGLIVTFNSPLTIPPPDDTSWEFSLVRSGVTCLSYRGSPNTDLTLTVGDQIFTQSALGQTGIQFTCPDGSRYSAADALPLLECPEGVFGGFPGELYTISGETLRFELLNTTASGGTTVLFECQPGP